MKIFTSYFGNMKKLQANNIMPVAISLYVPKFYNGSRMVTLAPTHRILYGKDVTSSEIYTKLFKSEVLGKCDAKQTANILSKISNGKDIALLCYEKPSDFCHRHLVAEWLNAKTELKVEEFGVVPKSLNENYIQGALF